MRCVYGALCLALSASGALAQGVSEIVIPSRPDVPLLMNGVDISYAVIEGDLGLDRPGGQMTPTIIYRLRGSPYVRETFGPSYYPRDGKRPGYGRLEVEPPRNRRLPPPAPSYSRSWSSESPAGPVTTYPTGPTYWSPNGPNTGPGAPGWQGGANYDPNYGSSYGPSYGPGYGPNYGPAYNNRPTSPWSNGNSGASFNGAPGSLPQDAPPVSPYGVPPQNFWPSMGNQGHALRPHGRPVSRHDQG
jgi:hypothetical protein